MQKIQLTVFLLIIILDLNFQNFHNCGKSGHITSIDIAFVSVGAPFRPRTGHATLRPHASSNAGGNNCLTLSVDTNSVIIAMNLCSCGLCSKLQLVWLKFCHRLYIDIYILTKIRVAGMLKENNFQHYGKMFYFLVLLQKI